MTALLCLVAGTLTVALPAQHFTLRWQHSVEKVLWEEDYAVAGAQLRLLEARVRGSGAGMEPPEGAVFDGQAWRYRPANATTAAFTVARSSATADYELCIDGRCHPLSKWVPLAAGTTTLRPCAS